MLSAFSRPSSIFALLICALLSVDARAVSDLWTQDNELTATTPEAVAGYGAAISADGDIVAIGQPRATVNGIAQAGSVEVWRRHAGWTREATLTEFSPRANAHFGAYVTLRGDTLRVGGPDRLNGATPNAGEIVTFVHNASNGTWQNTGESFGTFVNEHYGTAIAVDGDLYAESHPGSTVFVGGYVGVQYGSTIAGHATLSESAGSVGDNFGASIAVYRSPDASQPDLAVIGAPNQSVGIVNQTNGAVYVFANATHAGSGWQQVAHLTAPNSADNQFFGRSVAVGPGKVIVGAPGRNKTTGTPVTAAGSVFVFVPDGSGGWTQQSEIFLSPAAAFDGFGATVAYDAGSGRIFAGAPQRTLNVFGGTGPAGMVAVFRFKKIINFIFDWVQVSELESLDFPSISQSAGSAVAVSRGTAFVGAPDYDGAGAAANSGRVLLFTSDEIFANSFD